MLLKWLAELGIQQSGGSGGTEGEASEGHPAGFAKIEEELKRLETARSVDSVDMKVQGETISV